MVVQCLVNRVVSPCIVASSFRPSSLSTSPSSVFSPRPVSAKRALSFGSSGLLNSGALEVSGRVSVGWPGRGRRMSMASQASVEQVDQEFPLAGILELWRGADAVCFDVDSTACEDEGIDELAAFCGAGEAVAAWTARAMGGSVPFEVALAARLDLFKPSASDLAELLASKPPRLSPGIKDLVSKLHSKGKHVYLVSGGFRQMIQPAAELLGISKERIYANTLLFDRNGEFAGFDTSEPTSRSGGKAKVIEKIKAEFGYKKLVMIGDGATDLEARRPGGADMFICYGGVAVRPKVREGADVFVTTFTALINTL